jgi:hypothetical protein
MVDSDEYWKPICDLATRLRCWVRLSANDGRTRWVTDWRMLLLVPSAGYLEVGEGPVPIRHVEWVELSTLRVQGGLAGRPLARIDMTHDILSGLQKVSAVWKLRDTAWSLNGMFEDELVRVVHLANPFAHSP